MDSEDGFEKWCILELMGHRRLAGLVTMEDVAGKKMLRIDVFCGDADESELTQFYSPDAVYCMTPTTEAIARGFSKQYKPKPIQTWDLPAIDHHPDDEPF